MKQNPVSIVSDVKELPLFGEAAVANRNRKRACPSASGKPYRGICHNCPAGSIHFDGPPFVVGEIDPDVASPLGNSNECFNLLALVLGETAKRSDYLFEYLRADRISLLLLAFPPLIDPQRVRES